MALKELNKSHHGEGRGGGLQLRLERKAVPLPARVEGGRGAEVCDGRRINTRVGVGVGGVNL
jgi:hypothetical protein